MWTPLARLRDRISAFYGLGRALKFAVCGSGSVLVILLLMRNNYRSDVSILPSSNTGSGGLAAIADLAGLSVAGQSSDDQNYEDVIKSRWVSERLLNTTFDFHTHAWVLGAWKPQHMTLYQYLDKKNMDTAYDSLNSIVLLNRDFKSQLLTISVDTQSPELSQAASHRVVELMNEFLVNKMKVKGGNRAVFCKDRLAEAKAIQAKVEENFRLFLEKNRTYPNSPEPAVRLDGTRLETEMKMRQQITATLAMNLEQALLDQVNNTPVLNILDSGNLPENKSWPMRAKICAILFVLLTFGTWGWINQKGIRRSLFPGSDQA